MQVELLDRRTWRRRVELANAIFDYLEIFHNRQRRHSRLGMLTPSSSRLGTSQRQSREIQQRNSTEPRARQSLHRSRPLRRNSLTDGDGGHFTTNASSHRTGRTRCELVTMKPIVTVTTARGDPSCSGRLFRDSPDAGRPARSATVGA
jgi:hypothetical protein